MTHIPFLALEQVTLSPTSVMAQTTSGAVNLYKHCGVHLKLKAGSDDDDPRQLFSMTYAKSTHDEDDGFVPDELKRSVVAGKSMMGSLFATKADFKLITRYHSCDQYERRLMKSRQHFAFQTLDHLYSDETMVGAAVVWRIDDKKAKLPSIQFLPKEKSSKRRNIV